jgi:formylglycine-generating enzyme required for sulfatase activity
MEFQAGTKIRDYVIERLIGGGGMGEVYLARDVNLNRKVAVKVLRPELTHDQTFAQRFKNEAQVQAQLNHPNIVTLYSFFDEGRTYFIIQEFAEGITLDQLIRQMGIIPEERAMRIFSQIASALSYAHKRKVVHRDIKPSNIMVDTSNGDAVKVMDFGIARMMDAGHITRTGTQMGTIHYMSPEQVLVDKDLDHRSDIYSAGIVLYEMLSGRLPYNVDTDSPYKVQEQIIKTPIPDPRQIYEFISPQTVSLLASLTSKDRNGRPMDIQQAIQSGRAQIIAPRSGQVNTQHGSVPETKMRMPVQEETAYPARNSGPIYGEPRKSGSFAWVWLVVAVAVIAGIVLLKPWQLLLKKDPGMGEEIASQEMILVPAGEFVMGSDYIPSTGVDDERPPHSVNLSAFYIAPCEVTQAEWESVMGYNNSQFRGPGNPVESVTWLQALDYCNRRSIAEGLQPCYTIAGVNSRCDFNANGYRLPTEAEWEYAAIGGPSRDPFLYAGSNDLNSVAWYAGNTRSPQAVGQKAPNALGLYDMTGNVREWCWDWYYVGYYGQDGVTDPVGPSWGEKGRQIRGGSYTSDADHSRLTFRAYGDPIEPRNAVYGLRVVRSASLRTG